MTDNIITRYFRWAGRHHVAFAVVAAVGAAIVLVLNPDDPTVWILAIACVAWLGLIAIRMRRDGRNLDRNTGNERPRS
jgi:hypothetical protein